MEQVTRKLSECGTVRPIAQPTSNPFKRKHTELPSVDGQKLFVAAPPKKSTITLEQYKQRPVFGTASSLDNSTLHGSSDTPSNTVPLLDLNIDSVDLFGDMLAELNEAPYLGHHLRNGNH